MRKTLVGLTTLVACVSAISSSALMQDTPAPFDGAQPSDDSRVLARMQRDLSFLLSLSSDLKHRVEIAEGMLAGQNFSEHRLDSAELSIAALQT